VVGKIENHQCTSQFIPVQKRRYVDIDIEITPEMHFDDIKDMVLKSDTEENRAVNYYRFNLKGYIDPDIAIDWIKEELRGAFYYFEFNDKALEIDLDIDLLLKENRNNMIGKFIQEMLLEEESPAKKKALYYGLEGILKEKVVL
ncbi:MAG: DNA repair exonuclease, partial [Eubacterium sp.]